ncbi:hypothetical protein GCM10027075_44730 [Streptomyces heilongjiangensis]
MLYGRRQSHAVAHWKWDVEPQLTLAFALHANPRAYAVLLGAGVSIASGMPSAWDVQEDLIRRIARTEGVIPDDPEIWYKQRFGVSPTYDGLLGALTRTSNERQALLRAYFEPTGDEKSQGIKTPTMAHQSLARLTDLGLIRVIMTINFDRLMETALRDVGIEPTVVAHPSDIAGMAPLHTLQCVVIHLHGDYLNPTSMLNTSDELASYAPGLDKLLDQVFDEYGLIISGWSAKWDVALRNSLTRCPTRRFTTYWVDPFELSPVANDVRKLRQAEYVKSDADTFFGRLVDSTEALLDIEREHPASIATAVSSAKRALGGSQLAISLHDTIRQEISRVSQLPVLMAGPWDTADVPSTHAQRLELIEAQCEKLLALTATMAYWGSEETDKWWVSDIERFAHRPNLSGSVALIELIRTPATFLIYAAGIGALAGERWGLVNRLLTEPQAKDHYRDQVAPASVLLSPGTTMGVSRASSRLYDSLKSIFVELLSFGESAYRDAWERFEYMRLIMQTDYSLSHGSSTSDVPHIRAVEDDDHYLPAPAAWLARGITLYSGDHPLLSNGLFGGDLERLDVAKSTYDARFSEWAENLVWRQSAGSVTVYPSDPWYPDSLQ